MKISEKDRKKIEQFGMFRDISWPDILEILDVYDAHKKHFRKKQAILRMGEYTDYMGIIMKGSVIVERNDYWGRKTILMKKNENDDILVSFAQLENAPCTVDIVAAEPTDVFFLKIGSYDRGGAEKKPWYGQLARNLITTANSTTLESLRRSYFITPRKIRERVFAYLNTQAINNSSLVFDLPFNRQQLAEYLNVDRSALSKELSDMKREGYIDFHKNHFRVLVSPDELYDERTGEGE